MAWCVKLLSSFCRSGGTVRTMFIVHSTGLHCSSKPWWMIRTGHKEISKLLCLEYLSHLQDDCGGVEKQFRAPEHPYVSWVLWFMRSKNSYWAQCEERLIPKKINSEGILWASIHWNTLLTKSQQVFLRQNTYLYAQMQLLSETIRLQVHKSQIHFI